jgi:hypothetical protein
VPTFGRQLVQQTTGIPIQVTADGNPDWKVAGITIDWSLIAAVGSDTVSPEGFTVKSGQKWLRYGQVMAKVTTAMAQTITVTGIPTGGSFNIQGTRPDTNFTTVQTVPFNSSVAGTQALMDAIFGVGNTLVSGAGALPGNVQTVTFQGVLATVIVPLLAVTANNLTGGASPAAATAITAGANTGKYGPYDPGASDGRQTLLAGNCGILNESVVQTGVVGLFTTQPTDNPGIIQGGRVWKARIIQSGVAAASLAAGPTFNNLMLAIPRLTFADN